MRKVLFIAFTLLCFFNLFGAVNALGPTQCGVGDDGKICDLEVSRKYVCLNSTCKKKEVYDFFGETGKAAENTQWSNKYFIDHNMLVENGRPIVPSFVVNLNCSDKPAPANLDPNNFEYTVSLGEQHFKEASFGQFTPKFRVYNYQRDGSTPSVFPDSKNYVCSSGNHPYNNNVYEIFKHCRPNVGVNGIEDGTINCSVPEWKDEMHSGSFQEMFLIKMFEDHIQTISNLEEISALKYNSTADGIPIYYIPAISLLYAQNGGGQAQKFINFSVSLEDAQGNHNTVKIVTSIGNTTYYHHLGDVDGKPWTFVHELAHGRLLADYYNSDTEVGRSHTFSIMSTTGANDAGLDFLLFHKFMLGWIRNDNEDNYLKRIEVSYSTSNVSIEVKENGEMRNNECSEIEGSYCVTFTHSMPVTADNIFSKMFNSSESVVIPSYQKHFMIYSDYDPINLFKFPSPVEIQPDSVIMGRILHIEKETTTSGDLVVGDAVRDRFPATIVNSSGINNKSGLLIYRYNRAGREGLSFSNQNSEYLPYFDIIEPNGLDTKSSFYLSATELYKYATGDDLLWNLNGGIVTEEDPLGPYFDDAQNRINEINNIVEADGYGWIKGLYPYLWDSSLQQWVLDVDTSLENDSTLWEKIILASRYSPWVEMSNWEGNYYRFNTNDYIDSLSDRRKMMVDSTTSTLVGSLPSQKIILKTADLTLYPLSGKDIAVSIKEFRKTNDGINVNFSYKVIFSDLSFNSQKAENNLFYDTDQDGFCDTECINNTGAGCIADFDITQLIPRIIVKRNDEDKNNDGMNDIITAKSIRNAWDTDGYSGSNICFGVDNCPEDYNKHQLDSDGDGVGDICDACPYLDNSDNLNIAKYRPEIDANGKLIDPDGIDSDLDGVPDVCDNCPNTSNPRIGVNPYQEIFLSPCDAGTNCEGGAYSMSFTINGGKIYTNGSKVLVPQINWSDYSSVYHYENVYSVFYAWQPDNDLDGIGDACDYSGGNGIDNTDMKGTSTARILNVIPISKDMTEEGGLIRYRENSLYKLTFLAAEWTEANSGVVEKLENTVHFCGMPQEEYVDLEGNVKWGQTGFCTTSKATVEGDFWFYKFMPNSDPVLFMGTEVEVPFGYSHGTDPAVGDQDSFPWTHIARTGSAGSAEGIAVENVDEYRKPVTYRPSQKGARCIQTPENSGTACLVDTYWNWRMDALDYMDCESNDYSLCDQLIADAVTDSGETEIFHHTLSAGAKGIEDNYLDEINGVQSINPEYFHNKRKYARSARKTFWDMEAGILITGLKVRPIDWTPIHVGSLQPFPGIRKINHWQVDGSKFRLIGKILPENSLAVTTGVFNTLYSVVYVDGNRILRVNHEENPSDWHDVTVIPGWPAELDVSSLDIAGSSLYVTGRDEELPGSPFRIYRYDMNPAKMTFEVIAELSVPLLEPGIMEIGGKALIKGINIVTQKLEFYEAGYNGAEKVGEIPVRYGCTVIAKDGLVYVTGGIDGNQQPENNVLVSNDSGRNFSPFADFEGENIDLTMSFVHFSGGKMYVVNPKENTDGIYRKVAEVDLSDGSFNISLKQIEGITVEQSVDLNYCLNETGNLIKGGLEELGTCMPFTYPWYRSFATGSTIYSVAGKGDRLYVGTNNSIKVYDISDPEALVLKSTFSTGSRRVYDLEVVEGDIMYAATSGGIYKLNTVNPDTLASLSFFATSYNYQYRIQLYNDKLYVGDDNGINIRHKDTFTRLAYVNVGSVPDFAITNGEIALYRSSFWSSGLHIRDVDTLNLKAYEYAECYTGELTTDHGAFYLSCDGYEYRFEGRPDTYFNYYPLDGDIREMQENHVYNGWTYIYDGSNVKLSTLNDVPSYCGNGVIEEGELCDGNSVACTTISSSYVSGTAYCNSTCNGYNESNCSTDGW
ncbi:MAG TPA: hypothetical protein VLJ60_04410 [bacterium]|nr:hypothetical protein [bacterium]